MTRKNILLITVVLVLGACCFYVYRDRFRAPPISIGHRFLEPRDVRRRRAQASEVDPIIFLLNRQVQLTSVKVVPVSALSTNRHPPAVWELISDSNSVPVKDFMYGVNIRGMRLAAKGAAAGPLQPGVEYRLTITAGSHKAEHDFTPRPRKSSG